MDNEGLEADLPAVVRAAYTGALSDLRRLLAAGADPDEGEDGWTGLLAACGAGRWQVARVLLEAGADVHPRPRSEGRTPVMLAAAGGDLDLVKALAERGAPLDGALAEAATSGQLHVMSWLVESAGAMVDQHDGDGFTALLDAAEAGEAEAIRELLRLGADPSATAEGHSAADLADRMGHSDLASELRGERVPTRQLRWMKWFGERWHLAEGPDKEAVLGEYRDHLASLRPDLPPDLLALAEGGGQISLHDAHILVADEDEEAQRIILDFQTEDYFGNAPRGAVPHAVLRLRMVYDGATLITSIRDLKHYVWKSVDVIDGELDRASNGRFEHRLQFERDHPTAVIRFKDATVTVTRYAGGNVEMVPAASFSAE